MTPSDPRSAAPAATAAGVPYRLTLSYRGGAYAGWQRQNEVRTVQQEVEDALAVLLAEARVPCVDAQGAPRPGAMIHGAGRTDAGVHARGQVAHLRLARKFSPRALVAGTNHRLPPDIRITAAHRMPPGFHARMHAAGKEYAYRWVPTRVISPLDDLFAVEVPARIDIAAMAEAAAALPGRHDFTAFALTGGAHTQPWRRMESARIGFEEGRLVFRVVGQGFLRGMVRTLAGTLVEVGLGRRTPTDFARLLEGRPLTESGRTAPPQGLTLEKVFYPPAWWPEPS